MNLSPADREAYLDRLARFEHEETRKAGASIGNYFVIPLAAVVQITGMTRQQVPKVLPITKQGRKAGVMKMHLTTYLEKNTTFPKGWKQPEPATS